MRDLLKMVRFPSGQLGTCPRCMRAAFTATVGATLLAALATALTTPVVAVAAWIAAASLAALWIGHVGQFTARSIKATAIRSAAGPGRAEPWSRRRVIAAFFNVLVFSAALTVLPRRASAQVCNCYSDSDCYCPTDFPQCIYNPTTGDSICCGAAATGCAGPERTWCCASPTPNCNGDGSTAPVCR